MSPPPNLPHVSPRLARVYSHLAPNLVRAMAQRRIRVGLGREFSEGARLLWDRVTAGTVTAASLATTTGLDESAVHMHLYGDRRPRADAREHYATLGIPVAAWDKRPAKPFALPALVAFIERATSVLTAAGKDGLDIGALGKACGFATDDCEADHVAITVVYLLRAQGTVERVPGGTAWRLKAAKKARARKATGRVAA